MTEEVVTIPSDFSLREAAKLLREEKISGAPVMENEELIGVVSEEDILESFREENEFEHGLWLPSPFELVEIPIREVLETRKYKKLLKEIKEEINP